MTETQTTFFQRWYSRLRWWVMGLSCLLLVILLFQNLETVEVRLFLTTFTIPSAALIALVALLGFVVGAVWSRSKMR